MGHTIYNDLREHSGLTNVKYENEETMINDMYDICKDRMKWKKTVNTHIVAMSNVTIMMIQMDKQHDVLI